MNVGLGSTSLTHTVPAQGPDWQNISSQVTCPLCGYNLRGLIEPRCPECGYQFEWRSILNANNQRHPYLFEHHPERNFRSFLQTFLRPEIGPKSFWGSLNPAQPTRIPRLVLYWSMYSLIALIPLALGLIPAFQWAIQAHPFLRGRPWVQVWRYLTAGAQLGGAESCVIVLLLFPWLNFGALMLFQQSIRRAKIKPVHVLRCAIYSGDVIVWFSLVAAIALATVEPYFALRRLSNPVLGLFMGGDTLIRTLWISALGVALVSGFRLFIACRDYLKIRRALSLAIASQVVVAFAVLAALWVLPQLL